MWLGSFTLLVQEEDTYKLLEEIGVKFDLKEFTVKYLTHNTPEENKELYCSYMQIVSFLNNIVVNEVMSMEEVKVSAEEIFS